MILYSDAVAYYRKFFTQTQTQTQTLREGREIGAAQAMKRIPLIKFPQRHPKPSGKKLEQVSLNSDVHKDDDLVQKFFSRAPANTSVGGKASDQPKRTPVTQEEIDAVMLGGCF